MLSKSWIIASFQVVFAATNGPTENKNNQNKTLDFFKDIKRATAPNINLIS
jgi:hypothetical protein